MKRRYHEHALVPPKSGVKLDSKVLGCSWKSKDAAASESSAIKGVSAIHVAEYHRFRNVGPHFRFIDRSGLNYHIHGNTQRACSQQMQIMTFRPKL